MVVLVSLAALLILTNLVCAERTCQGYSCGRVARAESLVPSSLEAMGGHPRGVLLTH